MHLRQLFLEPRLLACIMLTSSKRPSVYCEIQVAESNHHCSSLTFWCHTGQGTVLTALLQPPPEVFDLFDDLILLAEGVLS